MLKKMHEAFMDLTKGDVQMRRLFVLTGMLLLVSLSNVDAKEINMLFMGNSFTKRSNLPQLVKQVFEEGQPDLTVNVDKIIYGGMDLFRHHDLCLSETAVRLNTITIPEIEEKIKAIQSMRSMEKPPAFYNAYWEKVGSKGSEWSNMRNLLKGAANKQRRLMDRIKKNDRVKWDYLVLQSWQDVVPDMDAGYAEYARKFAKLAEQEGIKVILYITAPYAQNSEPVTEPLALERTEMELKAIQQLAELIKPHAVVPVPLGIKNIQQNGTDLTFRYVKDFHPNQYTAFLTANMFYAAFFKESTEGFKFDTVVEGTHKGMGVGKDPDGNDAKVVFDDATKTLLQKAAFDAVKMFDSGEGK